jgi:site-specific recombinase
MHASIVVKKAIDHLNVQNQKRVDHRLVQVVVVAVAVEHVVVVLNVVLVVIMTTAITLVKQLIRKSNLMTTTD